MFKRSQEEEANSEDTPDAKRIRSAETTGNQDTQQATSLEFDYMLKNDAYIDQLFTELNFDEFFAPSHSPHQPHGSVLQTPAQTVPPPLPQNPTQPDPLPENPCESLGSSEEMHPVMTNKQYFDTIFSGGFDLDGFPDGFLSAPLSTPPPAATHPSATDHPPECIRMDRPTASSPRGTVAPSTGRESHHSCVPQKDERQIQKSPIETAGKLSNQLIDIENPPKAQVLSAKHYSTLQSHDEKSVHAWIQPDFGLSEESVNWDGLLEDDEDEFLAAINIIQEEKNFVNERTEFDWDQLLDDDQDDMLAGVEVNQDGSGLNETTMQAEVTPIFTWTEIQPARVTKFSKFFKVSHQRQFKVEHNLQNFTNLFDIEEEMDSKFEGLVTPVISNASPNDIVFIGIANKDLNYDIFIPPCKVRRFDKQQFLNSIYEVVQSNAKFLLDGLLDVTVSVVTSVRGSGKKAPELRPDFVKRKRSIIPIYTTDEERGSCGWKAIFLGMKLADGVSKNASLWEKYRLDRRSITTEGAIELARTCGFHYTDPLSADSYVHVQSILNPKYCLAIIGAETKSKIFYDPDGVGELICLEYETAEGGHYNLIRRCAAHMGRHFYCLNCMVGSKPTSRT